MFSSISIDMGYNNNPFVVLPFNKTNNDGMTVASSTPTKEVSTEFMNNLNDIKAADTDGNNILSLSELQNFEGKTEFAQTIMELMEKYAMNFRHGNYYNL